VWPGTAITGFPPGIVIGGAIHDADPVAMQAQADVTNAYNVLAGLPMTQDLTGQDLGGLTLLPGVYHFATSAQLTGTLTLNTQGNPDSVFVFQIGTTLTTASNSTVATINGPDDCHIYWQIGSSATLGTGTHFQGNILASASITLTTGATILSGRALAQNGAVTLDSIHAVAGCTCLLTATSIDCNGNGVPDECDLPGLFPEFITCIDSPIATVGVPLVFQVCANAGTGGTITMTVLGLPAGATLSVPLPAIGASICTTFSWTPTASQATVVPGDAVVLEFFATDANGCSVLCKMRILVVQSFLLLSPGSGNGQFMLMGHMYNSQLGRLRLGLPVDADSNPSFSYNALPSHYFAQVVMYNPIQFPQQPERWSYPMEFIKDPATSTMHSVNHGTTNGIDLSVNTFIDVNGQVRVNFPFKVKGM
jgi:hypothetical protein